MVADKQTNKHTYKQQNKLHTEINKEHKKEHSLRALKLNVLIFGQSGKQKASVAQF